MAGVFTMSGGMVALTIAHYTSWNIAWGPLTLVLTVGAIWLTMRGVKLSTTAVGVAVLVQVRSWSGLRRRAGRPACPSLGRAVLLGAPHRRPGRPLRGLPAGPVHVHRMGKRSRAGRGVPRSRGAPFREPCTYRSRSAGTVRLLRLCDGHRIRLRRLLDRALVGPVPQRGRPLSRRSWPSWPGSPESSRCSPPWSPARTPRRACCSTAAELVCSRPARPAPPTGRHAGQCAVGHGGGGLGIIGVWWVSHLMAGDTGSIDPVGLYAECSTMGTIVILFVYLLTTVSLPSSCGAGTGTRSRSPPRGDPVARGPHAHRAVRRIVQAGPARALQRVPVRRAGDRGGGRRHRLSRRAPPSSTGAGEGRSASSDT